MSEWSEESGSRSADFVEMDCLTGVIYAGTSISRGTSNSVARTLSIIKSLLCISGGDQ